tara:strand:- start:325 stop:1077 length:753 start_codon:yes stop_codon:yes gene_type:complete
MSSKDDIKKINNKDDFKLEKMCKYGDKCFKMNDSKIPCQFNHYIYDLKSRESLLKNKNFCKCDFLSHDKSQEKRCREINCKKDHLSDRFIWAKSQFIQMNKNGFKKDDNLKKNHYRNEYKKIQKKTNKKIPKKNKIEFKTNKQNYSKNIYDYKTILTKSLNYLHTNSTIGKVSDEERKKLYMIMNILGIFLNENNTTVNDELSFEILEKYLNKNVKALKISQKANNLLFTPFLNTPSEDIKDIKSNLVRL